MLFYFNILPDEDGRTYTHPLPKDLGFIGRLGKTELGAAALGNTVFYLLHYPMLGVMTAIDTLLATTFGAGSLRWGGEGRRARRGGGGGSEDDHV